jgi:hypothetical protein
MTGRFCSTCGASLEAGRAFCGQCGAPVSDSGFHSTAMRAAPSGSGVYRATSDANWSDGDEDAPTVADMSVHDVYEAAGYGLDDSSRALRIWVGALCLIGSFATAIAAIVLALATFH